MEDGVPVAEGARQGGPRAARAHHPQHRFDEEPVVASAASRVRRLSQAMRFHLRPLGVSQHKSFHPKLESQTSSTWNPKSQQALVKRSEEHTSELQSLMRISYADFCSKKKKYIHI